MTVKLNKKYLSVKTDEFGYFMFNKIEPSDYDIYVMYKGKKEFCVQVTVNPGKCVSISEIVLSNGEVVASEPRDFELDNDLNGDGYIDPANCGIVVGKYIGKDGKPVTNQKIYLSKNIFTTTDKNGEFRFDRVPAGNYKLYLLVSEHKGKILEEIKVKAGKGLRIEIDESEGLEEDDNFDWLIIVIVCAGVLVVAGGVTAFLLIKMKMDKSQD